jgi:predicted DNA-binding transcriptional regulator AlpA
MTASSIRGGEAGLKSLSNRLRSKTASNMPAEDSQPQYSCDRLDETARFLGAVASSGGEALVSARYVRLLVGDVSTATLYRMLASGDFPRPISVTVGRKAWPLSAVQAWIRQRTTAPVEGAQL